MPIAQQTKSTQEEKKTNIDTKVDIYFFHNMFSDESYCPPVRLVHHFNYELVFPDTPREQDQPCEVELDKTYCPPVRLVHRFDYNLVFPDTPREQDQ